MTPTWLHALAGSFAGAQTVHMVDTPNAKPAAPDDRPGLPVPESPRGLVLDVITAVIADQVAGPIVNDAAQIVVDKVREKVGGEPDAADAAPDDGGFLDS